MDKGHEWTLLQRGHTDGHYTYEKMLDVTNHQRNANKIITRYHFTPVRMAIINKLTSVGEDAEKREPSCTAGGNADWCSYCGKQYRITSEN